ncbi:unnamed protein product [Clonostachys rosea]|uniref:Protein-arginine deiminase C-terminal domain-containing protein n=1 Tax=Bionectria ochroleuca TaxID=29856 RepID=A0ABY6UN04_BIOOC|nr:unnamed protein product [Clonostachys rosea]
MLSTRTLFTITLSFINAISALEVTILADTNRDGSVDIDGDSDKYAKNVWTEDRGALFLANIADTNNRCSEGYTTGNARREINSYLDTCNDAEGTLQRNPKYLAPLITLPVTGLRDSATASVYVTDTIASGKVRIFSKQDGDWIFVPANHTFNSGDIRRGLELGIDARDVRRPGGWNGTALVEFTVSDGNEKATDSVALRVAPILTHHHGQIAERVFATKATVPGPQADFVTNLIQNVADAGIDEPVFEFLNGDIWTQDFFEPGYSSIPGPNGPVVLRIMIKSAQDFRPSGEEVFTRLRSDTVGAVQHPGAGMSTDSMGNLETIPPYSFNGRSFPAGRVIMGSSEGATPLMFSFLQAQETQDPLELNTTWLKVGHVDEFVQFLPANNDRGWVLMADDPVFGLNLLKKASKNGYGHLPGITRPRMPTEGSEFCIPSNTIDEVLSFPDLEAITKTAAQSIDQNLEILKRETGITEDEIIRIPGTFYYALVDPWTCLDDLNPNSVKIKGGPSSKVQSIFDAGTNKDALQRRELNVTELQSALYPAIINGVVLSDSLVLAPNPWGPIIDGVDIFADAAVKAYGRAGFNVTFQDDWFSHHIGRGEVHCGSNTWRRADIPWWK